MSTNDLTDLMHSGERQHAVTGPDLDSIRRRGGRRRRLRRASAVAAGVAAAAVVATAVVVVHQGSGSGAAQVTAQDHDVTDISAYEQRVLDAVPDAYAVDGAVIVPGVLGEAEVGETRTPADRIFSPIEPLGFHAYAKGGLISPDLPAFVQDNPPAGSTLLGDEGAAFLACASLPNADTCSPAVLGEKNGTYYFLYGLGTRDFLKPGAEMELFTDADYSDGFHATVIGGFDGTAATRVAITTVDGQTVAAKISDEISPGDTMFWATLPSDATRVTAYDASGQVVATHRVRPCRGPLDCEVR